MKLIDMSVADFTNEVDSNSPAPGGGSVSALASDIGVSLARMMAHLSFEKKKFEQLDEKTKDGNCKCSGCVFGGGCNSCSGFKPAELPGAYNL